MTHGAQICTSWHAKDISFQKHLKYLSIIPGGMHPHVPKNAKCNWLIEDDKTILRNPLSNSQISISDSAILCKRCILKNVKFLDLKLGLFHFSVRLKGNLKIWKHVRKEDNSQLPKTAFFIAWRRVWLLWLLEITATHKNNWNITRWQFKYLKKIITNNEKDNYWKPRAKC